MHIDQILFSLASFLFILMPIMSWVSTIIALVLPGAKQPLNRFEFQDKVFRLLLIIVGVRVLMVGLALTSMDPMLINSLNAIPIILYSIIAYRVAQRLSGMGYNRFLGLVCIIPVLGPIIVGYLYFTVRERS
jgi:hypothetical protein